MIVTLSSKAGECKGDKMNHRQAEKTAQKLATLAKKNAKSHAHKQDQKWFANTNKKKKKHNI